MSRVTVCWRQIVSKALLIFFACAFMPAAVAQTTIHRSAIPLFCAFGGVEFTPKPRPPDFESQFAVAVVLIDSPVEIKNAAVTDFVLFDNEDRVKKLKRVAKVEVFDAQPFIGEHLGPQTGLFAYYLNEDAGTASPWDGTLPAGKIRLRVRVALTGDTVALPARFRLTIGQYVIEGPVDGKWPI